MKKFKQLVFIDDREADNYYNKYIVDQAKICDSYLFFNKAKNALLHFKKNISKDSFTVPDLIFLDLVMPGMDCWDFLKEYAKLPKLRTKIIILTTSDNPNDIKKINNHSLINGYKIKPLDETCLKKWIKKI